MQWLSRLRHLLGRWLQRQRVEDELDEEVRAYFDTMVERRVARGMSREEALRVARIDLGGAAQIEEQVRDARLGAALETAARDLRYALRMLRRNPGFAAIAILSLALGFGANIAIFTLVKTVMLESLPVKDPQRLVFVDDSGGKEGGGGPPYPCYERLRSHNHFFSGMAAFAGERFKVTIDGAQEQIRGQFASGSYFDVLGVGAVLGRVLSPADDSVPAQGGPDGGVAVISYGLWERRFERNPAVLGKTIQVGTKMVTIVGVTPPEFFGLTVGAPLDLTIPMMLTENNLRNKGNWWFSVVARLKDGVAAEPARAELDGMFQQYMAEIGMKGNSFFSGIVLLPASKGDNSLRRRFSAPLLIATAIAGLVLLIGCANVASLLLARASARRHEIAVRLAIGASRARVVRQLVTEGLLLSAVAAGAGLLLAKGGVAALVAMFAGIRGWIVLQPHFDLRVAAYTAAVAAATGFAFSLAPALHTTRRDAGLPRRAGRSGNYLVVMQIMLSVVLLSAAALFLRSLHNLTSLDPGFRRESVLTMQVDATLPRAAPAQGKAAEEQNGRIGQMWDELLAPLRGLPQVSAASVSTLSPIGGHQRGVGMTVIGAADRERGISLNHVSASYFQAFGIALRAGRVFAASDRMGAPRVAILNEAAARRFFGDASPLGRHVIFPNQQVTAEFEVVGVVGDARYRNLRLAPEPMVYLPIEQAIDRVPGVTVATRAHGGADGLVQEVRRGMRAVVPGGFLTSVVTVQQQVDESLLEDRLLSILASLFGSLALLLAAIGLYGMMSFTVVRRTRELGIRIAIGAPPASLVWMVLRSTLVLAAAGIALGTPLVLVGKKYIESELFGLQGSDPLALAGAALLLAAVAAAAGFRPAWRASRLHPMISLRQE
jgi:predicted permease